jgi:hypothetical protein
MVMGVRRGKQQEGEHEDEEYAARPFRHPRSNRLDSLECWCVDVGDSHRARDIRKRSSRRRAHGAYEALLDGTRGRDGRRVATMVSRRMHQVDVKIWEDLGDVTLRAGRAEFSPEPFIVGFDHGGGLEQRRRIVRTKWRRPFHPAALRKRQEEEKR